MPSKMTNGRGGARPGAGRPPLPAAKRRRNAVSVVFTDGERAAVARAAGREPVAVFIRRVVLASVRRRK